MLFLVILILSFHCSYFLPWWIVAVIAFLAAFFLEKVREIILGLDLLAVFIAWAILALLKSIPNDNILADTCRSTFCSYPTGCYC